MKKHVLISILSAAILAVTFLTSCGPREVTNNMTFRYNQITGDRISLLGFGCLRLPMMYDEVTGERVPDQEEINRLFDIAIAHGVNFFDNAPSYLRGHNERVVGIALARHPRNSFYVSTKLSNFTD